VTPIIITNMDDFGTVTPAAPGKVDNNSAVITYSK
jgi:hypothetical protein